MNLDRVKLLIFMSMFEVSNNKQEEILNVLEDFSLDKFFENPNVLKILSREKYQQLAVGFDRRTLDACIENFDKANIKILTVFDDNYPSSLVDLPDRPLILFAKGDLSLLDRKCLAVVGTRYPSNYGKVIAEKFVSNLVESGFVIVSGLCFGIDSIAHRKTLDLGGKTIAVVGSGFNHIYPSTNTALAKEISEKGLILSEYPPSFVAKRYTFPRRNRIVVGISSGILIPEASTKSGTVYTKDYALEYGKDIFAVPGSVLSDKSGLPNLLIKSGQAECVCTPNEICEYYGMKKIENTKSYQVSFDEKLILDCLSNQEQDFDHLAEKTKIPVNILNSCLTTLEIRGLIKRLPAKTYSLA